MSEKRKSSGEPDAPAATASTSVQQHHQVLAPQPPPPPAWRVRLNHGPLRSALVEAKSRVGERCHAPFKTRVSKAAVPDYGRYVAPAQEMWLDKVKAKIERCDYESSRQMRRDVAAIAAAARAYNDATTGGTCRSPALVGQAKELAEAVERALNERAAEIEEAEAAADRPASAINADEDNGPDLPEGFEHEVRFTDAKPHGWAEYRILCPKHGEKRVDRLAKLAGFFCAHAKCRPREWGPYAREPGETRDQHLERLRPIFAFSKALPPAGSAGALAASAAVAVRSSDDDDGNDDDEEEEPAAAAAARDDGDCCASPPRRSRSVGGAATLLVAAAASDEEDEGKNKKESSVDDDGDDDNKNKKKSGGETLTKHLESAIDGFLSAAGALDEDGVNAGGGRGESPPVALRKQHEDGAAAVAVAGPAARARSLFSGLNGSPLPKKGGINKKRHWIGGVEDAPRAVSSPLRGGGAQQQQPCAFAPLPPPPPVAPPAAKRSRSAAPTAAATSGSVPPPREVGALAAALADAGALADAASAAAARLAGAKGLLAEASSRLRALDADAAAARADAAAARAEAAASEAKAASLEAELVVLRRRLEDKEAKRSAGEATADVKATAAANGVPSVSVEARAGWDGSAAPAAVVQQQQAA